MTPGNDEYVFVNCPFDEDYKQMFQALVFTIYKCNLLPRCSLELDDSGQNRFDKIVRIIRECKFGVHDISRTELNSTGLPRFNMPLELGLFLGATRVGGTRYANKRCLILDKEQYRYQEFMSDIAGQDIKSHGGCVRELVIAVRNWLSSYYTGLESGSLMWDQYIEFRNDLPQLCLESKLILDELTFADYIRLVYGWLGSKESDG